MFRKKKEKLLSRQYYVQFLGWLPCNGIQGSEYTAPAIAELKKRLKEHSTLPKLTLKINDEGIEVSPITDTSKKKSSNPRVFPIKLEDIMFVSLEGMESDIVACIYRNRNTQKSHFLQVHVYRFDSSTTAVHFVQNIQFMTTTEAHLLHVRNIEQYLHRDGLGATPVTPKSPLTAQVSSGGSSSNAASDENVPVVPEAPQVQAITAELNLKFKSNETLLLLPAKDYDTVRRKQGHIDKMGTRKCRNEKVVGALKSHFQNNDGDNSSVDDDDDDVDDNDDANNNNNNGAGPTSPYPLYPVRKSPASPPISSNSRSPRSPDLVKLRDNMYQRTASAYGSNNDVRKSAPVPLTATSLERQQSHKAQNSIFRYDQHPAKNESPHGTVSSDRSGSSHHSNPTTNPMPTMPKPTFEIPPDYDVTPQASRYRPWPNQPSYGYYRDDLLIHNRSMDHQPGVRYPERPYNSNMNLNHNYSQPQFNPSELYSRPITRPRNNKNSR